MVDSNIKLRNIGPTSATWLLDIGVTTVADISRLGPIFVMQMLLEAGHPVSLNMLYSLHGAAVDLDWRDISQSVRFELQQEYRVLKGQVKNTVKSKQRRRKKQR